MLKISANTENTIWVNASRNKTLSNPTYMMSLEHKVSGERKYFIPQNITSISGNTTYQEDPRVDLFKFGVFNNIENLTGGTRYWVKERPPALVYLEQPLYYPGPLQGTDKTYIDQFLVIPNIIGIFRLYLDTKNPGEVFTGGTLFADGIDITTNLYFGTQGNPNNPPWGVDYGIPYADAQLNQFNKGFTATTFTYKLETNSGRTFTDTIHLASIEEIQNIEPWQYFGDKYQDNFRRPNYPRAYLGTTNIYLENYGWYYYRIYEQTSQTNLNPALATNVVDEGTLYIYPPPPDEVSYTGYSTNDIVVYDEDKPVSDYILQEDLYNILTENNELLTQE
jgi:hypothetical protein